MRGARREGTALRPVVPCDQLHHIGVHVDALLEEVPQRQRVFGLVEISFAGADILNPDGGQELFATRCCSGTQPARRATECGVSSSSRAPNADAPLMTGCRIVGCDRPVLKDVEVLDRNPDSSASIEQGVPPSCGVAFAPEVADDHLAVVHPAGWLAVVQLDDRGHCVHVGGANSGGV